MEIKNLNSSMINAYKSVTKTRTAKENQSTARTGGEKFDKIEFDFDRSIGAAKANIASDIKSELSSDRLAQLQAAYSGDNCPVSAEDTANAILG